MLHSSKYLIDEYPMTMLPSLASRIGGDEAIVLQQIQYWIKTNEAVGNERVYKDGRWWVFNTVQQWQEKQFIWLAAPTVKRILQSLEQMNLVKSERFEKHNRNNRKWYTINHDSVERLNLVPVGTCFIKLDDRINLISSILTGSNRSDGADQIDPVTGSNRSDGADRFDPVIFSKEITKETTEITPLTPQGEWSECVAVEVEAEIVEEEVSTPPSFVEKKVVNLSRANSVSPDGQVSAGRRDNSKQVQKLIEKLEAGEITRLPSAELKLLADAMLGNYVHTYRHSGNILSLDPNDIDKNFLTFIAKRDRKDNEYASRVIRRCEETPSRWGELTEMVKSWKAKDVSGYSKEHVSAVYDILSNIADL